DFTKRAPRLSRFAMVFEVADTSYAKDRSWKWRRYAASRIPVYGILDLNGRRLQVFTNPAGRGSSARYDVETSYAADEAARVVVAGQEVGRFRVREVLP